MYSCFRMHALILSPASGGRTFNNAHCRREHTASIAYLRVPALRKASARGRASPKLAPR